MEPLGDSQPKLPQIHAHTTKVMGKREQGMRLAVFRALTSDRTVMQNFQPGPTMPTISFWTQEGKKITCRHNHRLVVNAKRGAIHDLSMPRTAPSSVGSKSEAGHDEPTQTKSKAPSESKPSKGRNSDNRTVKNHDTKAASVSKSTIVTPTKTGKRPCRKTKCSHGAHSYRRNRRTKIMSMKEAEKWADAQDGSLWVHKDKQTQTVPKEIFVHGINR
mmetsp:Transcript_2459/g.7180  ORF Transcript_2459/g.7180 Transcript_2459/m.7180 type:complete len:217 (-) Transcript_2459:1096-1746(-)